MCAFTYRFVSWFCLVTRTTNHKAMMTSRHHTKVTRMTTMMTTTQQKQQQQLPVCKDSPRHTLHHVTVTVATAANKTTEVMTCHAIINSSCSIRMPLIRSNSFQVTRHWFASRATVINTTSKSVQSPPVSTYRMFQPKLKYRPPPLTLLPRSRQQSHRA